MSEFRLHRDETFPIGTILNCGTRRGGVVESKPGRQCILFAEELDSPSARTWKPTKARREWRENSDLTIELP